MKTGKLVIIGGGEAKEPDNSDTENGGIFSENILLEVINEVKKEKPEIVIIPFASNEQNKVETKYKTAFKKIGHKVTVLKAYKRSGIDKETYLQKVRSADIIFLTGGDQRILKELIDNTRFLNIIIDRYNNDQLVIAGTSAGAMVMSDCMILRGESDASIIKGNVEIGPGIGLIKNVIIDTHFMNRGRFSRLVLALMENMKMTGLGICEDTALVVQNGNELSVVGSGTVTIVDVRDVSKTNYSEVNLKEPVTIENLKVHILSRGSTYGLKEHHFTMLESESSI